MQFDLADFHNEKEVDPSSNEIRKYLLCCVDSFSRFVFCVPLSDRKSKNVIVGLKNVFATGYVPRMALGDPAGEHISILTKKFFKSMNIHLYFTTSKIHAPQAERFIRTLRAALRRYRSSQNTNKWIHATSEIVSAYNRTVTRVHGHRPIDVFKNPKIAWEVYNKLYSSKKKKKHIETEVGKEKPKKVKKQTKKKLPKIGEWVRLSRIKHPFEKESNDFGTFSREVFKIVGVDTSKEYPMFKLEDVKGKPIKGKAYLEEIQTVPYSSEQYFEVEKVIHRKKIRNVKYALVKWKGYNNRYNSWIPEADLKNLFVNVLNYDVH